MTPERPGEIDDCRVESHPTRGLRSQRSCRYGIAIDSSVDTRWTQLRIAARERPVSSDVNTGVKARSASLAPTADSSPRQSSQ